MTPALAQREVALAGVALLAAVIALAVASPHQSSSGVSALPQPVSPPGGWYPALAGASQPSYGQRTKCGVVITPDTLGVADAVIPCNSKIYVTRPHEPKVLTQVIDKRPIVPGRRFDLTPALAEKLELQGIERIYWTYAR
jgi:hypothetical protein